MDRNLGALSAEEYNMDSHGNYYQFGRKDPFNSSASHRYDINGVRINPKSDQYNYVVSTEDINFPFSVSHPDTYITHNNEKDWVYTNPYIHELWNNPTWLPIFENTSLFDPCPLGWIVPPKSNTFSGVVKKANNKDWKDGYSFYLNGLGNGEFAWFPAAGQRPNSSGYYQVSGSKSHGYYYQGEPYTSRWCGYNMDFSSEKINSNGQYGDDRYTDRASAYSVRCIQE